jgi:superfamily II DNA or RNA helicase
MNDIIYCLFHKKQTKSYKIDIQGRKIGSTRNIISRIKTYQTGFPDMVPLECYYRVSMNCYILDDMIKKDFNKYRLNTLGSEGGTEFYDTTKLTIDELEKYFTSKNIIFEKFTIDDIINEIKKPLTEDDYDNMKNDINNMNNINYLKLKPWQEDACNSYNDFMKSDIKSGLIIAPTGCGKSFLILFISIMCYIKKYMKDVIIMTKRKEIFDSDFVKRGLDMIKQHTNLKINIINIIDSKFDYNIFKQTKESNIFIVNTDKFVMSPKFSNYTSYDWGNIKLGIIDECHWAGASKLNDFLMFLKNHTCDKVIGFSATPVRFNEENYKKSLELFKKDTGEFNIIYQRSYIASIEEGDRVKTEWLIIPVNNMDLDTTTITDDDIRQIKCLNNNGIISITKWLNDFIINSIYMKGILWFANKKNLKRFYNYIRENKSFYENLANIKFYPTYSKINEDDSDTSDNITLFKARKNKSILLAIYRGTEGFDDMTVDFGFNMYVSELSNPLLDQQKEGRVCRTCKGKTKGYFGFLCNISDTDHENIISKRLGDWINYINEYEKNYCNFSKSKKEKDPTTVQYIEYILDINNIKIIDYESIKNKIYKYCEKIDITNYTINDIKRIIAKENKNKKTIIDTKQKYDLFAVSHDLPLSDTIECNNWVKLLHPNFEHIKTKYYSVDELRQVFKDNMIENIDMIDFTDPKIPPYDYLNSGFYNTVKHNINLVDMFYRKKIIKKF